MLSALAANVVKDVSWCWEMETTKGQMLAPRYHHHLAREKVLEVRQCALCSSHPERDGRHDDEGRREALLECSGQDSVMQIDLAQNE